MINESIHFDGKPLVSGSTTATDGLSDEQTILIFISFVFVAVIALSGFFLVATMDG